MKIKYTLILTILFIFILISGCIPEREYIPGNETTETTALEILEHEMVQGQYGSLKVIGTAKNVGDKQLAYVEIRVKFYDKDNVLLETFLDNINDLNAGETWQFEVLYLGLNVDDVDHYNLAVGSVF